MLQFVGSRCPVALNDLDVFSKFVLLCIVKFLNVLISSIDQPLPKLVSTMDHLLDLHNKVVYVDRCDSISLFIKVAITTGTSSLKKTTVCFLSLGTSDERYIYFLPSQCCISQLIK